MSPKTRSMSLAIRQNHYRLFQFRTGKVARVKSSKYKSFITLWEIVVLRASFAQPLGSNSFCSFMDSHNPFLVSPSLLRRKCLGMVMWSLPGIRSEIIKTESVHECNLGLRQCLAIAKLPN